MSQLLTRTGLPKYVRSVYVYDTPRAHTHKHTRTLYNDKAGKYWNNTNKQTYPKERVTADRLKPRTWSEVGLPLIWLYKTSGARYPG